MEQERQVFRGRTEVEARRQAQAALGLDCEILRTRAVCDGVWNRFWGWKHFEVEAVEPWSGDGELGVGGDESIDLAGNRFDPRPVPLPEVNGAELRGALQAGLTDAERHAGWNGVNPADGWLSESRAGGPAMACIFREMVWAGVPESTARQLLQEVYDLDETGELDDPVSARAAIGSLIAGTIRTVPAWSPSASGTACMAIVGPAGAGKTMTLVKLAAHFGLVHQLPVAIVTADTMRVAAAEQLRALGELLDVPVDVVSTAREMRRAVVGRQADHALVLIDTPGRNPRDHASMHELGQLLNQARPDRVHLVLSATDSAHYLTDTASAFAAVGANSLILTRLDECSRLGQLLPLLLGGEVPLAYCSAGQNLRSDLATGDPSQLMSRMLGGHVPREVDWQENLPVVPLSQWTASPWGEADIKLRLVGTDGINGSSRGEFAADKRS